MTHDTGIEGPAGGRLRLERDEHALATAALDEITQRGWREGSLARVAEAAGMTPAHASRVYPDERELLIDVLRLRDDLGIELLPETPRDGRGMLQAFIDIARFGTETPGTIELFGTLATAATAPEHPGHEYFRARYAWLRGLLVDALRELEEEGELKRRCDPQGVAAQAIALLDGLQIQWLLDRDVIDVEGLLRSFLDRNLHEPLEPARPIVAPRTSAPA
ncbi:TetR family transcriptional regulator C-terminal domain-containing protein [Demequina sp. SYSU T00192]|uniref:TetR family transcriptional regulator C-terminal domain-containing protein n=1 Tax=Demequina litoralis TaxID=3051660 RepID=A0ABT8GA49_9MICO|nr:TetR family transcriptional regulator C-terminal domain-containing protein [Demequina sp. SYSU T00192]MDN4476000.1 TetR family transcriptional regulator C-terminal domain-containing protein [Demequina sp. SYSU T00192]